MLHLTRALVLSAVAFDGYSRAAGGDLHRGLYAAEENPATYWPSLRSVVDLNVVALLVVLAFVCLAGAFILGVRVREAFRTEASEPADRPHRGRS